MRLMVYYLFGDIFHGLFPYAPKSRKTAILTPESGGKPRTHRRRGPQRAFPGFHAFGWYHDRGLRAPSGATMGGKYPVTIRRTPKGIRV